MIRTFPLLCMAAALSGCASMTYPVPKCDGYSRRPLNRSMWQWEDNSNLKQKHSDARPVTSSSVVAAYAEEKKEPPAFAHFDAAASYRRCEG
ncbi:type IV secretion system protein VirB7 [Sinorhizobium fredii]|uniref:Type IV secretion system protein VirB7 n=1 Tax=Sinorhizobium fredii (strain USDA 257) TaxID=1185652 RepID=I3X6I9_SINF2|nr:hypothetical protein [Sinorhizobium fredii]AFL51495.1 type IV secretion system protein VirB7 [Sinorhizobium fredii USDA 257]